MSDLREYPSVQKWLAEPPGRGFQPVREDPAKKVAVLAGFCEYIGVDPDTLAATCTDLIPTGKAERNKQLKSLKVWINSLPDLTETQRTKTENTVRGFFIKNGIKVMTRPYPEVYRRAAT
ncbi:MAG TPA: hypothetical protein VE081_08865 [Sporichthyaceae bacterium]|nr:hypothetical protein [Sporichthyaceae bacterium]